LRRVGWGLVIGGRRGKLVPLGSPISSVGVGVALCGVVVCPDVIWAAADVWGNIGSVAPGVALDELIGKSSEGQGGQHYRKDWAFVHVDSLV
jgi:hypothetical protein